MLSEHVASSIRQYSHDNIEKLSMSESHSTLLASPHPAFAEVPVSILESSGSGRWPRSPVVSRTVRGRAPIVADLAALVAAKSLRT